MQTISHILATIALGFSSLFGNVAPTQTIDYGTINAAADFRSSLATGISSTDTTMTLVSLTSGSETLEAGKQYGFKIGGREYVLGTVGSNNQITGLTRGVSRLTGTTSVTAYKSAWGRGTAVEQTDAPILLYVANILSGYQNIESTLRYSSAPSFTYGLNQLVTWDKAKDYTDSVAVAGAPDASEIVKGNTELATAAEAAAGTSLGGTGARLVLPASLSTSTPNTSTATGAVPTSIGRYLSQTWLDLTGQSWTFSNLFATNATTTGTHYFPSILSSVLKTDSTGKVQAATRSVDYAPPPFTVASTTAFSTGSVSCTNSCTNRVYATSTSNITIPAGWITASSTLEVSAYGTFDIGSLSGSASGSCAVSLKAGNVTLWDSGIAEGTDDATGMVRGTTIFRSVSSQVSVTNFANEDDGGGSNTSSSVDFSSAQTLSLVARGTATSGAGENATLTNCTIDGYTVIVRP